MPQFSVHRNPNPATRNAFPLLLDIQSDLIAELGTRVVVPLCPASAMKGRLIRTLVPVLEVDGKRSLILGAGWRGAIGSASRYRRVAD